MNLGTLTLTKKDENKFLANKLRKSSDEKYPAISVRQEIVSYTFH